MALQGAQEDLIGWQGPVELAPRDDVRDVCNQVGKATARPYHFELAGGDRPRLLLSGVSWKWLYRIAGSICVLLIVTAVHYPQTMRASSEPEDLRRTIRLLRNPYALAFSIACFFYVAVECAINVWLSQQI